MSKTTLLIDGDILAYRAAASAEHEIRWDDNLWTLHSDLRDAQRIFYEQMQQVEDALQHDRVIIALSPEKNFRYRIWPQYKANRVDKRRPMCLAALKEWIEDEYETFKRPDIEADDVLGILATSPYIVRGRKCIVSVDKDFRGVPCEYYNLNTEELVEITEPQADQWHMLQTLMGDAADGYPGCPKCGPKTAEKILNDAQTYETMWPLVVQAYEKQGLGEEYALTMARLARICRRGDYDFKKKEVILWTPPTNSLK